MKISEAIEELQLIQKEFGDVELECRNPAGDFDRVGVIFWWDRHEDNDVTAFIGVEGEDE